MHDRRAALASVRRLHVPRRHHSGDAPPTDAEVPTDAETHVAETHVD
jgi:hypothetical protein